MAGERILVIDDEETILGLFQEYFTTLGYQVVTAQSAHDVLEGLVPGEFDSARSETLNRGRGG